MTTEQRLKRGGCQRINQQFIKTSERITKYESKYESFTVNIIFAQQQKNSVELKVNATKIVKRLCQTETATKQRKSS